MWTDEQREAHKPRRGRYPSDITDAEWAIVEPMIPPAQTGGRRRETDMREVFNAIRYIDRTGCQWRLLPKDFPPHTTVYRYFCAHRQGELTPHRHEQGARRRIATPSAIH